MGVEAGGMVAWGGDEVGDRTTGRSRRVSIGIAGLRLERMGGSAGAPHRPRPSAAVVGGASGGAEDVEGCLAGDVAEAGVVGVGAGRGGGDFEEGAEGGLAEGGAGEGSGHAPNIRGG